MTALIMIFEMVTALLTGPGLSRKPDNAWLGNGINSLPPTGGLSTTDCKLEKENKCKLETVDANFFIC